MFRGRKFITYISVYLTAIIFPLPEKLHLVFLNSGPWVADFSQNYLEITILPHL